MAHGPATPLDPVGLLAALTTPAGAEALSWNVRPEILGPLALAAGLYTVGWRRLGGREPGGRARLALALGGLLAVAVALLSPLDALAHRLFVAHMVQHMLLIAVAAPALLLADPYPALLWALPRGARGLAQRWLRRDAAAGRAWRALTPMPAAWACYMLVLWLWHLPDAYDAALGDRLLHDLEHASFFGAALLFWWPVIHPAPRFRRRASDVAGIVYLVLAAFQTAALGLLLTLTPAALYAFYADAPRPPGFDALDDQVWGGVVMWGVGGLVDMIAVLALVHRAMGPSPTRAPALTPPGA